VPAVGVDWSIFGLVALEVGSGLVSLTVGRPGGAWLFTLHAIAGFVLVGLLGYKFARVRRRVTDVGRWTPGTAVSVLLAVVAVGALSTGVAWALGGPVRVAGWPLLMVHMTLGVAVVPVLAWHLRHRFRPPSREDLAGRRTAIKYSALLGAGALAWGVKQRAADALGAAGADRRFTGSKEAGSDDGNDFPVTSWALDDPDPVSLEDWTLTVTGEVAASLDLTAATLDTKASERAVLDCTSGWYSDHEWRGVRVGSLLAGAEPTDAAAWVRFRSVTGYHWSLPLAEARDALLATHVDGDRLTHGHGYPIRLVAPGRRGFQWVKWVDRVTVTRRRDLGQWVAIFVSGLE
jgi:DMSO/TMAO reductase YedYZ molybdopterin-dependent catalytic subunit